MPNHRSNALEIDRHPLHQEVADRIRLMITEGRLAPGSRLNERVLSELLRVSRTPLREAFKVLMAERLVELSPHRGARVVALARADVEQLFELMGALEGLSGQLAAERRTTAELAEIRALHYEMLAAHARGDLSVYYGLNRRIHEALNRCARNQALSETYNSVNTRIQHLRFCSNFDVDKWRQAVREHQAMLDALEAGDGARLRALLEQHLRTKCDTVLAQWPDAVAAHASGRAKAPAGARAPAQHETSVKAPAAGGAPVGRRQTHRPVASR